MINKESDELQKKLERKIDLLKKSIELPEVRVGIRKATKEREK